MIKFFKYKSIQTSIIAGFLCLTVFSITIIGLLSYKLSSDAVEGNAREYTYQIIQQVNSNIEYYINSMEDISEMAILNYDIIDYLSGSGLNSKDQLSLEEQKIVGQFNNILNSRKDISSIMIFGYNGTFISNRNKSLNPFVDPKKLNWYKNARQAGGKAVISSSHVQNVLEDEHRWVVSLSRELESRDGNSKLGIFLVDLNYSVITQICNRVKLGNRGYIFIVDGAGNIVYHPQQQLIYSKLKREMIDKVLKVRNGSFVVNDQADSRIYSVKSSAYTGWKIVGVSYLNELVGNQRKTQTYYILGGLGCFLIAISISVFISLRISRPIKRLEKSMKEVRKGNLDIQADIESSNEIGELSRTFNKMTTDIKELIRQNTQVQELKRKSELQALLAQINPHFLYNTLDSIIWMAEGKKSREVVQMTSSLARLFRLSLSKGDEIITIREEIEHIRNYLTIQKIRYGNRLDFEIQIDDEILRYKVLKVLLQPIVENAIYHGIKNKTSGGTITITGARLEDHILLQVIDNGVGMTPEQLDGIFATRKTASRGSGIGVKNVNERIRLYFGHDYGLSFESEIEQGTTVNIRLPVLE